MVIPRILMSKENSVYFALCRVLSFTSFEQSAKKRRVLGGVQDSQKKGTNLGVTT